MSRCGLFHASSIPRSLPLDGIHVAVQVVNLVAEVQIVQFFVNDQANPIDCFYEFPLDESGAVCAFEVELADRLLVGEVKERQEARAEYSAAIARGETAALLEQNKPDVFAQRIGNIRPQSRVNIRIVYVTELQVDSETGGAIFVLPTSLAPRYSPFSSQSIPFSSPWHTICCGRRILPVNGYGGWNGLAETLPWQPWTHHVPEFVVNEQRPCAFSVTIEVETASRILSIESKTFPIKVEYALDIQASASLWQQTEPMGKDLEIIIFQEKLHEPSVQLEVAADGSGCAMLTLVPEFDLDPVQTEIVFLVDCSGSMDGNRIDAAKRALLVFLQSLPISCKFNIVSFGRRYDKWSKSSRTYDQSSLESARSYVSKLGANMGGTELLQPLELILARKPSAGSCRQVFVLTDGQVTDTERVIETCRRYADHNRVFSVGIGDEVSRHLVQGIARAANGTAEFILGKDLEAGSSALQVRLVNQLKLATYPGISKVIVDWLTAVPSPEPVPSSQPASRFFPTGPARGESPGAMSFTGSKSTGSSSSQHAVGSGTWHMHAVPPVDDASDAQPLGRNDLAHQAPFLPPPLFSGAKFLMFCFLQSVANLTHVSIVAEAPGGQLALNIPVTKVSSLGKTIHTLAARALIRDLDEGTSHLHFRKMFPKGEPAFSQCRPFTGWLGTPPPQGRAAAWNLVPKTAQPALVKMAMVDLGTKYGIVSRETSFVAVERFRDGRIGSASAPPPLPSQTLPNSQLGSTASARLAVAQSFHPPLKNKAPGKFVAQMLNLGIPPPQNTMAKPTGSGPGIVHRKVFGDVSEPTPLSYGSAPALKARKSSAPQASARPAAMTSGVANDTSLDDQEVEDAMEAMEESLEGGRQLPSSESKQGQGGLMDLLLCQSFDGSIISSRALALKLGFNSEAELTSAVTAKVAFLGETLLGGDKLQSICFGLAFLRALETKFASLKGSWEVAAGKTRAWVVKQISSGKPNLPSSLISKAITEYVRS